LEERPLIDRALALAETALELILDGDIGSAMNRFNRKGQDL
jgi:hypothetical protein